MKVNFIHPKKASPSKHQRTCIKIFFFLCFLSQVAQLFFLYHVRATKAQLVPKIIARTITHPIIFTEIEKITIQSNRTKRPIGIPPKSYNFPIDIVYTWVNGSDPDWFATKSYYLQKTDLKVRPKTDASRYLDIGELLYSLRSIHRHLSWINQIYIVTDNQVPKWLNTHRTNLKLVNHTTIIPKQFLPTFNSNTIEFYIHKIPGLSEHFIYFNDDVFIAKKLPKSQFFTEDGRCYFPVSPNDWKKRDMLLEKYRTANKNDMGSIQYKFISFNSYKSFYNKFRKDIPYTSAHSYMPLTKTLMNSMFKHFSSEIEHVSSHRFRDFTDVNLALMAIFVGCGLGYAVPNTNNNASILVILDSRVNNKLRKIDLDYYAAFCLNSGEKTIRFSLKKAHAFLETVFKIRSPYEFKECHPHF